MEGNHPNDDDCKYQYKLGSKYIGFDTKLGSINLGITQNLFLYLVVEAMINGVQKYFVNLVA